MIRLVVYTFLAIIASFLFLNQFDILFYPGLILLGFAGAISSIMYSNIIRNQDISMITVLPIIMPIIFFILDHFILNSSFTSIGFLSLLISITGTYLFMQNRAKLNTIAFINLSIMAIYGSSEDYYLKHINVSPILFFANVCLYSSVFVFFYLILTKNLFRFEKKYIIYTKAMFISKSFDLGGSIMFGYAALNATGVKVSTFELLSAPLALLITFILIKLKFLDDEYLIMNRKIVFGLCLILSGEYLMFIS